MRKFNCIKKILLLFVCFPLNAFAAEHLIFAVDLIRHGDRTPYKEIPALTYKWKEGEGELTSQGLNQEYQLGVALRKKYIDQYHLLPENYHPETMYVRSTDMNRTIMSAESLLFGLYPLKTGVALPEGFQPIPIHTLPLDQDKLLVVKPSRNVFSLLSMYIQNHQAWKEKSLLLKDKLNVWNTTIGYKIKNFKQLDCLADNLYVYEMHHVPLPKGISQEDANLIIAVSEESILNIFKHNEVTYPMGHEFLLTVANYMKQAIKNNSQLKYVLFSGHDSSLMAVMNTLGAPVNRIPYASDLNFTLWENNSKYYVRVSLNNQAISIPGCDGYVCPLSRFYKIIRQ